MRQIIIWSLVFLVLFIVFIGLAFVGLTYMTPSTEALEGHKTSQVKAKPGKTNSAKPTIDETSDTNTPGVADSTKKAAPKMTRADSLEIKVDELTGDLFFTQVTLDSLNTVLEQKQNLIESYISQVESLEENVQTLEAKKVSIKDLAKTYETMKVADIRPILERLDDGTIIALYQNMGSRTKKNLIQALSDVRAAKITKKLAGS